MNKIYKVIWSNARKCYVVVAEIAKNHGKNNVRSIVERMAAHSLLAARAQWVMPVVTAGLLLLPVSGWTSVITDKDGNSLAGSGNVHDIYAQKILTGSNVNFGVNRFQKFEISSGDIANMYFRLKNDPANVNSLVNLVKNRIDVSGTVNAIKDGRIGGDLYFISPKGMTVGKTGVINTGRFVAMVPSSSYFDGLVGTEGIWNSDATLTYQFLNDISNYGKRDDKGGFKKLNDLELNRSSDATIDIKGQINTRSGIVLGASQIMLQNGAVLKGQADIDFTGLVNAKNESGNVLTNTALSGADLTAVADAQSGDIILRAQSASEYANNLIPGGTIYETVDSTNTATVEVAGQIVSDGKVDVSADAVTTFDNTAWNSWNISQIGQNLANDLGFNWEADWAVKNNTASVTLGDTGSVKAGGDFHFTRAVRMYRDVMLPIPE